MSLFNILSSSFAHGEIGPAEIQKAVDGGIISGPEAANILDIKVVYSLEQAKKFKKQYLSMCCNKAIGLGVDVPLSDGTTKHFSLDDHDQTNLTAKMMNVIAGGELFEYHSDGEACTYYSADDMATICVAAQQKVSFETTYYNCLCQWMNSLPTADAVMELEYGMDIPEEFWSEPYRGYMEQLAQAGGEKQDGTEVATGGVNVSEQALAQYEPMETGPAIE